MNWVKIRRNILKSDRRNRNTEYSESIAARNHREFLLYVLYIPAVNLMCVVANSQNNSFQFSVHFYLILFRLFVISTLQRFVVFLFFTCTAAWSIFTVLLMYEHWVCCCRFELDSHDALIEKSYITGKLAVINNIV